MPFIEAPSNFYMGRYYDPASGHITDEVVYYESRDLTTHAVVVGMTGSGKTGLCITLLEEAILDGIPSIIIDPKGDITNLLLTFPDLSPQSFLPWINYSDATRSGLQPEEYAQDTAQRWREGLESWGIGGQRIATLKNSAIYNIYTPGSDAGLPISILAAMKAPREGWAGYEEYHREHIRALTTAILSLVGIKANPVKDREHVLIANIFEHNWRNGIDLTMHDIILQVQRPPLTQLGVFDIETFFPEKERFKLAMEMNNIIAAPSFQSWLQGEPLDMQNLLYVQTPQGPKPRVSIFYVAHLSEEQQRFMITLILESILTGMRRMRGTSSLRALLYFDEVFGHLPPYPKNPPTKEPLLKLLKQGRAFGIGTVLATQNPGDLDYKGLTNAGTWFIGRLQTENDKKKVLDGLTTASSVENQFDVQTLDQLISSVDPRVFVMNNVHDPRGPSLMHTRWAMSFLSGPLTREQIRRLTVMQQQLNAQVAGVGQGGPYQQPQPSPYGGQQAAPGYTPPAPAGYGGQSTDYGASPQQPPPGYNPPAPAYNAPPSQPGYTPPPAPYANATPPTPAPPSSLPESPGATAGGPPPPPSLPESTSRLASDYQPPSAPYQTQNAPSPTQYQPPSAPYQRPPSDYNPPNAPYQQPPAASDPASQYQYQPPGAPYQGQNAQSYEPAAYHAPPAPYQGQNAQTYEPTAYQAPSAPYQGQNAQSYEPAAYHAPSAPYHRDSSEARSPAAYQPPNAPLPGSAEAYSQYQPPAPPMRDTGSGYAPSPYQSGSASRASSPYGGTGSYPADTEPMSQEVDVVRNDHLPPGYSYTRPVVPSSIDQFFLPTIITMQQALARWERRTQQRAAGQGPSELVYTPFLLAQIQVRYVDRKSGINTVETYSYHIFNLERAGLVHWDQYVAPPVLTTTISHEPFDEGTGFGELPSGVKDRSRMSALKREVVDYLYKTAGIPLLENPTLKISSTPGMDYQDFQAQIVAAAREGRDQEIDRITTKFEKEFDRLEDRYTREVRELRADQQELKDIGREEMFMMGEAVLSLLKGRTAYTLSRVSRTRRYKGQAKEDVSESHEVLRELEADMDQLQQRYEFELQKVSEKWNRIANEIKETRLTPYKKDIHPELFGIGWLPEYMITVGGQVVRLPAWEGRRRQAGAQQPQIQSGYQGGGGGGGSRTNQQSASLPSPDYGGEGAHYDDYDSRRREQDFDDGHYYPHR